MSKKELELGGTLKNCIGNIVYTGNNKETVEMAKFMNSLNSNEFIVDSTVNHLDYLDQPLDVLIIRDRPDGYINKKDKIIVMEHFVSHGYLIDNGNGRKIHKLLALVEELIEIEQDSDNSGVPYNIEILVRYINSGKQRIDELYEKFREMFTTHITKPDGKGKAKLKCYMDNINTTGKKKEFILVIEADPSEAILISNKKAEQKGICGIRKETERMQHLRKLQYKLEQCRSIKNISVSALEVPDWCTEISLIDLEPIQRFIKEKIQELPSDVTIDYILYNISYNAILYKVSDIVQGLVPSIGERDGAGEILDLGISGLLANTIKVVPNKIRDINGNYTYKKIEYNNKLRGSLTGIKNKDLKLEILSKMQIDEYIDIAFFTHKYKLSNGTSWNYFAAIIDDMARSELIITEKENMHWIDTMGLDIICVTITEKGRNYIKRYSRLKQK